MFYHAMMIYSDIKTMPNHKNCGCLDDLRFFKKLSEAYNFTRLRKLILSENGGSCTFLAVQDELYQ